MAKENISNNQLLKALTLEFGKRFDILEDRFDALEGRFGTLEDRFGTLEERFGTLEERFGTLEEMVGAVKETVVNIADNMTTNEDLEEFKKCISTDFDDLEVRLGRRIDDLRKPTKKRRFIAAKP